MNGIGRIALFGTLLAASLGFGGCVVVPYPVSVSPHDVMMEYETSRLRYRVTAFLHYLDHARGPSLDYRAHLDFYEEADDLVAGLMLRGYNLQFKQSERPLSDNLRELRQLLRELEIEHRNLTCARHSPPCKIRITLECRSGGSCASEPTRSAPSAKSRLGLKSCRRCRGASQSRTQNDASGCQPIQEDARYDSGNSCSQRITCPQSDQSNCVLDDEEIARQLLFKLREIDDLLWLLRPPTGSYFIAS